MPEIDRVEARLIADATQFVAGMNKATSSLNTFQAKAMAQIAAMESLGQATTKAATPLQTISNDMKLAAADFKMGRLATQDYAAALAVARQQLAALRPSIPTAEIQQFNTLVQQASRPVQQFGQRLAVGDQRAKQMGNALSVMGLQAAGAAGGGISTLANALSAVGYSMGLTMKVLLPITALLAGIGIGMKRAADETKKLTEALEENRKRAQGMLDVLNAIAEVTDKPGQAEKRDVALAQRGADFAALSIAAQRAAVAELSYAQARIQSQLQAARGQAQMGGLVATLTQDLERNKEELGAAQGALDRYQQMANTAGAALGRATTNLAAFNQEQEIERQKLAAVAAEYDKWIARMEKVSRLNQMARELTQVGQRLSGAPAGALRGGPPAMAPDALRQPFAEWSQQQLADVRAALTQLNAAMGASFQNVARAELEAFRTQLQQMIAAVQTAGGDPALVAQLAAKEAEVTAAMREAGRGVPDAMAGIGRQAGAALVTGLMTGVKSMQDIWKLFLNIFTQSILNMLMEGLGIGSPSRLTKVMGMQLGQGLMAGMHATQRAVEAAALDLAPVGALATGAGRAVQQLGDLSLRASLDVSGVMGAPLNPFAAARDAEWQRLFRESALVARSQGFR